MYTLGAAQLAFIVLDVEKMFKDLMKGACDL